MIDIIFGIAVIIMMIIFILPLSIVLIVHMLAEHYERKERDDWYG